MRSATKKTELELIAAIYEAALEPLAWRHVLDALKDVFAVRSALLLVEDTTNRRLGFLVHNTGLDASDYHAYATHYIHVEPGFNYRKSLPQGTASASNLLVPDGQYEKTEYYWDFLRKHDLFYLAGLTVAKDSSRTAALGLQRPREMGPFEPSDLKRLQSFFPHLRRAFQIMRIGGERDAAQTALSSVLDRLPNGIVLLNRAGGLVYANDRARKYFGNNDGLRAATRGLEALDAISTTALSCLIHEAAQTAIGQGASPGGTIAVPRPSGRPPFVLHVTPLRTGRANVDAGLEQACVAVFITESDRRTEIDPKALRAAFDLTPSEARVAARIAEGLSPEQIATEGAVSLHTVRAQLRSVYEKLGVHRQAELVQLVLSSAAIGGGRPETED